MLVATFFFGPLALLLLSVVLGGFLIAMGARSTGWPRPALIVLGVLLVALPIFIYIDVATGYWVVRLA